MSKELIFYIWKLPFVDVNKVVLQSARDLGKKYGVYIFSTLTVNDQEGFTGKMKRE